MRIRRPVRPCRRRRRVRCTLPAAPVEMPSEFRLSTSCFRCSSSLVSVRPCFGPSRAGTEIIRCRHGRRLPNVTNVGCGASGGCASVRSGPEHSRWRDGDLLPRPVPRVTSEARIHVRPIHLVRLDRHDRRRNAEKALLRFGRHRRDSADRLLRVADGPCLGWRARSGTHGRASMVVALCAWQVRQIIHSPTPECARRKRWP